MKHYIGIDLGGTDIKIGVIREDYSIAARHVIPTRPERPSGVVVADMAAAGKEALRMAGVPETGVPYIGISVPSSVNYNNNQVIFANNLGWRNFDIIPVFQAEWDIPVLLANDADSAALAEVLAGAARQYDNVVMLTLGTGIGGGLIFNKQVYGGGDGYGTEPGHVVMVDGGRLCTCGALGCFETYASVTALIHDTIDAIKEFPDTVMRDICGGDMSRVNGRTSFEAAGMGDEAGMKVVAQYIKYLATGVANVIIMLRPQAVILGGGVCNAGDPLFGPLREEVVSRVCITGDVGVPPILKAELGNDAGMIGSALLGI